ncbi:MAG: hypothetical protein CL794_04485 [Chloroflexi bacterium]|nr:hypothetical protein [Chloroflexota bacterium]
MICGKRHRKTVAFYRDYLELRVEREPVSKALRNRNYTSRAGAHCIRAFIGTRDETSSRIRHSLDPGSLDGHLERNQLIAAHVYFNVEDLEGFTSI